MTKYRSSVTPRRFPMEANSEIHVNVFLITSITIELTWNLQCNTSFTMNIGCAIKETIRSEQAKLKMYAPVVFRRFLHMKNAKQTPTLPIVPQRLNTEFIVITTPSSTSDGEKDTFELAGILVKGRDVLNLLEM